MKTVKNILFCPLDWGLGHATRCVPIIQELLKRKQNVIIGADKGPMAFLKIEFPQLKFIEFPGYNIQYPDNSNMARKMIMMAPSILKKIRWENIYCKSLVKEHNIDIIISDNRYGLHHPEIPSVFITHQIFIKAKNALQETLLNKMSEQFFKKFTECWIPDFEGKLNLSGDLSHKKRLSQNMYFIGPLSRFANKSSIITNKKYELVVLISGPEPQRSIFEKEIQDKLKTFNKTVLILSGKPESESITNDNLPYTIVPHMNTDDFVGVLKNADFVISRSGYSTIMDLTCLGKKAVYVPTPGQTEQEYLARYHAKKNQAFVMPQSDLNFETIFPELKKLNPLKLTFDSALLLNRLDVLLV